ncbi:glycosyltransferase family 2 protein [Neobacillus sp. 179-J 1A1 HS]|uniref:glycosyltransferase family 2 protein n=1 Tax=Neobacillus driksii TaxID=3035913 RepID=UPI0035BC9187
MGIKMVDLTAIILSKNEEKNIEKCINSIQSIAKRIVVIDSFSNDATVALAKQVGADVYQNPFVNYATQFNWGLENTSIDTKWVLRIDADEEFTPELCDEINRSIPNLKDDVTGLTINLRVIFMGKWLKHGGMYPFKLLRIFQFGIGKLENRNMDEHVQLTQGEIVELKSDFLHHDFKDLEYWIKKHNWYSNREVMDYYSNRNLPEDNLKNGWAIKKRIMKNGLYYKLPMFVRAKLFYVYRYYIKRGFLDGKEGKIFHTLQAYWYRFLIDAKIYECEITGTRIGEQGDLK